MVLSSILRRAQPLASSASVACAARRHASTDGHVTVVGLGNMGKGMARNLLKAGESVAVVDINPTATDELKADGAMVFANAAEATEGAKAVVTMVPIGADVESVFCGPEGVHQTMKPGLVCMDSSTIDVATSQRVGQATIDKGGLFIDAPVSGGQPAAIAGNLIFMVGGEEAHFNASLPYLEIMGKQIIHCGPLGKGLVAKLCNNMMLGMSMIAASETMNMGINLGMDPKLLTEVLLGSSGRCWALDSYNPVPGVFEGIPSSRGYTGGFGSALMLKDLGLCQEAAQQSGSATPLGKMAQEIFAEHTANGNGKKDFSSIIEYLNTKK